MTDFIPPPSAGAAATTASVPEDQRPVCTPEEIAAGKVMSILSYVLNFLRLPFFLVPLIMRNDRFSLYHAKQCLILWLAVIVVCVVLAPLGFVTCGIGWLLMIACLVTGVVFDIIGLINAVNGQCAPLPVIGKLAEKWFAGIKAIPGAGAST